MQNKTTQPSFEASVTSALAVIFLIFCENLKKRTKQIHLTNALKNTEIRDENKNTVFSNRDKCLVKKVYYFCKEIFLLERGELTRTIVKNINSKVPSIDDQKSLLRFLSKNIEKRHPRPWKVSGLNDRIIDAKGMAFSFLSPPEYGLSFPDLQNLVNIRQKVEEAEPIVSVGSMVY